MPLRVLKELQGVERFLDVRLRNEDDIRHLISLAASACGADYSAMAIFDSDQTYLWYSNGFDGDQLPMDLTGIMQALGDEEHVVVRNLIDNPKLNDHKFLKEMPAFCSYLGISLMTHDRKKLGVLYVFANHDLTLSNAQAGVVEVLAKQLVQFFEFETTLAVIKGQLAEARQNEVRLKAFFESRQMMHVLIGYDFKILNFNQVFVDMVRINFGMEPQSGDDIALYVQQHNGSTFLNHCRRALTGKSFSVPIESINENGTTQWSAYFDPAYDPDGELIGVSCNAIDSSKEVSQLQQIQAQDKNLEMINQVQSHQLRGPLTSILALTDLWSTDRSIPNDDEVHMLRHAAKLLDTQVTEIIRLATISEKQGLDR